MAKAAWSSKTQQRTIDKLNSAIADVVKVGRMLPVPVTGLVTASALMTRGAQIAFQIISLQGVDSFVLLRNFSRDPGSAKVIHSWSAASLLATPQGYPINLQYMDADPSISGNKVYYWVKVVPVSNQTESNTFLSGPQLFDASGQPLAATITGDLPISQAYTPTTQPLTSTTGVPANQATITVAAFQIQYPFVLGGGGGPALISYNGGTITPLLDNTTYYVYFNDPTYSGGAQTYVASVNVPDVCAGLFRQYIGKITTPVHGGGGTGGGGGGGGPCFSANTLVVTKRGKVPIALVQAGDAVYSRRGWVRVKQLLVHDYDGPMHKMPNNELTGDDELVTPTHRMYSSSQGLRIWMPAAEVFPNRVNFVGKVFNLAIGGKTNSDDSHCYLLNNGWFAHNNLIK